MTRKLPRYVTEYQDQNGRWRIRFRRKGQATAYFKGVAKSDEFFRWYADCLDGKTAPKIVAGSGRALPGSMAELIERYYRSPAWQSQSDSTQRTYRGIIERFRDQHGSKPVKGLQVRHLEEILGRMAATPAAANNLRKVLRRLLAYAVRLGYRTDNPAAATEGFRNASPGFHTWTEEEIAAFQHCHASGTRARLALELMLWTGQRRSDIIGLGWQHVREGRLHFRQQKTGKALAIPIATALATELDQVPAGQMTFILTDQGRPFTANGFGNWFSDMCRKAGLEGCSAHGLRKAFARRSAEAGLTHSQGKAVTGHTKDAMFSHYAAEANQQALADSAMANLETKIRELAIFPANPMKRKGEQ